MAPSLKALSRPEADTAYLQIEVKSAWMIPGRTESLARNKERARHGRQSFPVKIRPRAPSRKDPAASAALGREIKENSGRRDCFYIEEFCLYSKENKLFAKGVYSQMALDRSIERSLL